MEADPSDDVVALLPPLLASLEALGFISRHLNPPAFGVVLGSVGAPEEEVRAARPRLDAWPDELAPQREALAKASDAVIAAFDGLRAAAHQPDGLRSVFKALGQVPRAMEALYPLAHVLPPVSRFFLDPAVRDDPDLLARLAGAPRRDDVGIFQEHEAGERGGFSLYVPEYYTPERAWPLVIALHGGSGDGRRFLWTWLRDVRSRGAILITPTSVGPTWALMGLDEDTPHLLAILEAVRRLWNIDTQRLLLTGMSDGGTFTYVSGLETSSPFTHLAPISASFHPMLAAMADPQRLRGLPIFLTHGALDWMFPIDLARQARDALSGAGANVTYREIDDLSHTYPREINAEILDWLG